MSDFVKITRQAIHATQYVRAHLADKKALPDILPSLLDRQVAIGHLEAFAPAAGVPAGAAAIGGDSAAGGWVMTDAGTQVVLGIYEDIRLALEHFRIPIEVRTSMCLFAKVTVLREPVGKSVKAEDVRGRIGKRWSELAWHQILQNEEMNPFLSMPTMKTLGKQRYAMGLVRKSLASQCGDLFIPRILGLAQLCGVDQLYVGQLAEIIVHSNFYEKLARAFVAMMIGNIDKTVITNMAFGQLVQGHPLGSTQYVEKGFANAAPMLTGQMVKVGTVRGGGVDLTYPQPLAYCNAVEIVLSSDAGAQEGEEVHMLAGWAALLALRPPPSSVSGRVAVHYDIHTSPLYCDAQLDIFRVSVKRVADRRLVGKPSTFGILKPGRVGGQGVYGRACACTTGDPARRVDVATETTVAGVVVNTYQGYQKLTFENLFVIWQAGDVLMQVFGADQMNFSTYVQTPGECLHCAIQMAMGTGCTFLVAGTFPARAGGLR